MHIFIISSFLTLLLCQTILGMDFVSLLRSGKSDTDNTVVTGMPSKSPSYEDSDILSNNSNYGLSFKDVTDGYRLDAENMDSSTINGITSLQSELPNSTTDNNNRSQNIEHSTNEFKSDYSTSTSTTQKVTGNSTNEQFSQSSQAHSSSESPNSTASTATSSSKSNLTSQQPDNEEPERVVIGKPSNSSSGTIFTSQPKTLYQRTLELINDTYTVSILLPIAAGIVFAATIIVFIATCRCFKRHCRRRRLRKKTLPDSVKNLRPSDRARLLAESSDEEF